MNIVRTQKKQSKNTAGAIAGIALALFLVLAPNTAFAVIVPPGPHSFDATLPANAFVSFNGSAFVTPGVLPVSTLGVVIDGGPLQQNYSLSTFKINSGFSVSSAFAFDADSSGSITTGDGLFGSIGAGSFTIANNIGVILNGTFTSATLSSTVSSTAGSLSASNINGLVLTPGPAFTFDTTSVSAIAASPTGFGFSLSSIPGGIGATLAGGPIGQFIPATINAFGLSSGSVVASGNMTVVPEPSTVALAGLGMLGLATLGWKRRRR